ncbi:MAG TPA: protein FdrA [Candidatus Dormibacteraeota bacterium]|nr:protein FdrA [Candidatus Dormibacteraeota bacterium]
MSTGRVRLRPNTYVDSTLLLAAARAMQGSDGVEWAAALMATPQNRERLAEEGFRHPELAEAGANDLVLAVRAASEADAERALAAGEGTLLAATVEPPSAGAAERRPRTLDEALALLPDTNLALISVPGAFAALEAEKALNHGLHVLLFSDNVPLEAEIELKSRALRRGLLVMGPGAGTAVLGGVGLGFANVVRRGEVGVVAAAGTGAQEVMAQLHRGGLGLSHVVGVGGRDVSAELGAPMATAALRALEADPQTRLLLLVSKPPAPAVAERLLAQLGAKPAVAAFIGLERPPSAPEGVRVTGSLEAAVLAALRQLGRPVPDPARGLAAVAEERMGRLAPSRRAVRGLFSGGTLCYEAMVLLSARLGPIHSNTPLREGWGLPAPAGGHVCLDLGEEEFTRGRPHPMLDPEARLERIRAEADDPATAVILLDVVLGHGAHPDPAGLLAPVCAEVGRRGDGPAIVAYVLGTDLDPQGYERQRRRLEEAGCLVPPTSARAALLAAALAARRPAFAEEPA